ncbi:glycoside hydrolase domain-containing protein [Streptomyces sp. NPDC058391]|uniref:glycoside hydrolase domain-containing protein n=1 Tax=unclassified Streptomyces TaxID=2593676 RepID=UPI0036677B94
MDEKVLAAQKWVNATYYGKVPQYSLCPETGTTGWATMYSLTRALQHELGITTLSDSFGPTTLSKLAARGDIGFDEPNANIRKIVQHALFCKGYWGGDGEGTYNIDVMLSVASLKRNAGLDDTNGLVQPKVFKALLSMDAYVLLTSGSEKVREIQRWLNGRYFSKSTFYVGPCDGIYSRDVQTALMKAIQYELGIPEDQVTGNFGEGTKAGLKNHTVAEGDSGVFVQIFSAACVFNEPVYTGSTSYITSFKSTFDSSLRTFVKEFQKFSSLAVSERGDFATWAQLLVSTGDPDRVVPGCDTRFTITPAIGSDLYDGGHRYVGRYLYQPPNSIDKYIKPGELDNIFKAGLNVFPIFQDNGRLLSDFDYPKGYQHGLLAHERASFYGFNRSTVIYFAVDYDATSEEIASNIIPYFHGVSAALSSKGKRYIHGVYGSRNVCSKVTKETYARYSFISGMSWGFSGNLGFPMPTNWSFTQIKEISNIPSADGPYDLDKDAHRPGTDEGQNSVNKQASPAGPFISYIEMLHGLAIDYGKGDPDQLVMEYVRHREYGDLSWWALIGDPDEGFISYANEHGAFVYDEFTDPFTGHLIGAEHLMATANAHYVKEQPSSSDRGGAGDVGGWAGDIFTFYGEWRRDNGSYPNGYTYCQDRLGKIGVDSTFGFNDLVEDADGYLIAEQVRSGKNIVTAIRDHYAGSGGVRRFQDYYTKRFSGSTGTATNLTRYMLTMEIDPTIALGREYLISKNAGGNGSVLMPWMLPSDKLTEFCQGFADTLKDRASQESRMKARYLARQKESLGDSA